MIRNLILTGAALITIPTASNVALESMEEKNEVQRKKARWIRVIDLERCIGCKVCTEACIQAHYVPASPDQQEWIKIYDVGSMHIEGTRFFPRPCMQCQNAPCVKVCPVGASFYNEDHIVLVNHDTCIGCRLCMAACPYDARYFNWEEPKHTNDELSHRNRPEAPWPHRKGVVEKCMLCAYKIKDGALPVCVEACPQKALLFGDLDRDTISNGQGENWNLLEFLEDKSAYRFKDELGTEPAVYYIPPRLSERDR